MQSHVLRGLPSGNALDYCWPEEEDCCPLPPSQEHFTKWKDVGSYCSGRRGYRIVPPWCGDPGGWVYAVYFQWCCTQESSVGKLILRNIICRWESSFLLGLSLSDRNRPPFAFQPAQSGSAQLSRGVEKFRNQQKRGIYGGNLSPLPLQVEGCLSRKWMLWQVAEKGWWRLYSLTTAYPLSISLHSHILVLFPSYMLGSSTAFALSKN